MTTYLADEVSPVVDPAGHRLVYVSNQGGKRQIWSRPLSGGLPLRLGSQLNEDFDPAFSPDGGRIAFASHRQDAKGDIFVMQADGSEVERLTDRNSADRQPAWFPDGKQLAYTSARGNAPEGIYSLEMESRQSRRLGRRPGFDPAVSPDGRFLVFTSPANTASGTFTCLWVLRLSDQAEHPLDGCDRPEGFATWTIEQGQTKVVFSRFQDDTNGDGVIDLGDRPAIWKLTFDEWVGEAPQVHGLLPLTPGASSDITPGVYQDTVYYASRTDEDLNLWSVPLAGAAARIESLDDALVRASQASEPLTALFLLRRGAAQLSAIGDVERCALQEAEHLLQSGFALEAVDAYRRLATSARLPSVHNRARLGLVAARMERELPVGLPPSQQQERLPLAEQLLRELADLPVSDSRRGLVRADLQRRVGRWNEALHSLEAVLLSSEEGGRTQARARLLRAEIWRVLGNGGGAEDDDLWVLQRPEALLEEKQSAVRHLLDLVLHGELPGTTPDPLERLQDLAQRYPGLPVLPALFQETIGNLQRQNGQRDLARRAFDEAERNTSASPEVVARALLSLSAMAEEDGDRGEALDHVSELLDRYPNEPSIRSTAQERIRRLGSSYAEELVSKGEIGMAIKVYRQLVGQDPDDVASHRRLIALVAQRGLASEAVKSYRSLAEARPEDDLALYLYALALTYWEPPKHFDQAFDLIQRALVINAQAGYAHQTLGWLYEQRARLQGREGALERAAEAYQAALNLLDLRSQPRAEADLLLDLANVNYSLGNYRQAYATYKRREASGESFALPANRLVFLQQFGRAALLSDEQEDAQRSFQAALVLAKEIGRGERLPWLQASLGAAYQLGGSYSRAVDAFREACRLYREQGRTERLATCQRNVAYNLFQQGLLPEAARAFADAEAALSQFGTTPFPEQAGVSVGLGKRASRAAYGFDLDGERNFLSTYQARLFDQAGDPLRAELALRQKIALLRPVLERAERPDLALDLAIAVNHLAVLRLHLGDGPEAAGLFLESRRLSLEAGSNEGVAINDLNRLELALASAAGVDPKGVLAALQEDQVLFSQNRASDELTLVRLENGLGVALVVEAWQGSGSAAAPVPEKIKSLLEVLDRSGARLKEASEVFRSACDRARMLDTREAARAGAVACANLADTLGALGRDEEAERMHLEVKKQMEGLALLEIGWRLPDPGPVEEARALSLLSLPSSVAGTDQDAAAIRERDRLLQAQIAGAKSTGEAFLWAERLLARRLQDSISFDDLHPAAEADRAYLNGLKSKLQALRQALDSLQPILDGPAREQARTGVLAAAEDFKRFRDEGGSPKPALRRLLSGSVLTDDQIRSRLEEGEGLLELVVLPREVVLFLLTPDGIQQHRAALVAGERQRLLAALRGPDAQKAEEARGRLATLLLGPFGPSLPKLRTLLAVTDDLDLPLALLPWQGEILGRHLSVAQLSCASELVALRDQRNLNLQSGLWVGQSPGPATRASLAASLELLKELPPGSALWPGAAREAGLLLFGVPLVVDPVRPLRSALDPDPQFGSLGGQALGSLAGRPTGSGLWVLAGAAGETRVPGGGLEAAMALSGVPTALVVPGGFQDGPAALVLRRTLEKLGEVSPAAAFSAALDEALKQQVSWRELWPLRLRGDPGLDRDGRKVFAERSLGEKVKQALEAHGAKRWAEALGAFLQVRFLAEYLKRQELFPKVDQGIVQSAFQLGELDLALAHERKLLDQAQASSDRAAAARARQLLGVLESRAGRNQQAVEQLRQAAAEFDALKLAGEASQALSTLALALDAAANYEDSLRAAQEALGRAQLQGDQAQSLRLLRMIGTTYLKRLNLTATAREWFEKALELARLTKDDRLVASVLLDLSRCEMASGFYDRSLATADEALALSLKIADKTGQAEALVERAHSLWYQSEYQQAFEAQRQALSLAQSTSDARLTIIARSLGGLIALNVGDLEGAELILQQALSEAHQAGLKEEEAAQLNNLGIVSRERGDTTKALQRFQEALRIDTELKNALGRAYDLRNLGIAEQAAGRPDQAGAHLEEALSLSRSVHDRFNEVKALHGLAQLELGQGKAAEARRHAQEAHSLSVQLGLREVTWRALRTLGEVARREGKLVEAREHYRRAIQVVEEMRAGLKAEEFRSGFLDNKFDLYEDMVHLLLQTGEAEEAFATAERSRARGFLDLLGNRTVKVGGEANQQLLARVRDGEKELLRLAEDLSRSSGTDKIRAQDKLTAATKGQQELVQELRRLQPDLSDFVEVHVLSPQVIRSRLPAQVGLLATFVTREDTVVWVIRADRFRAFRLPLPRAELALLVARAKLLIESFAPADHDLQELYHRLIAPLEEDLKGLSILGVLPHDVLNYLPFAALEPGPGRYWSQELVLFESPSVGVLDLLLKRQQERLGPAGGLLALGNPDLGDARLDLPFAEREVASVDFELPGGEVLLGRQATKDLFLRRAGESEFLHLACHGTFDPTSPLHSALKLAPGGDGGGDLTAMEVFSLSLSARLVTLSACQTGLGKLSSGDEIVGFKRAFLTAGAASVLSSLWRVSDVATAVLMKRFYRALRQKPAAQALQEAQRVVRLYFPHPAYWAGFTLLGTWK